MRLRPRGQGVQIEPFASKDATRPSPAREDAGAPIHTQSVLGDVFGSLRDDHGEQLQIATQKIKHEGRGIVLYLKQEMRGVDLADQLHVYQQLHVVNSGHLFLVTRAQEVAPVIKQFLAGEGNQR